MPTSKTNTNTLTKIELDAIPPSFPSSALFCFPTQNAAYKPAKMKTSYPKFSCIDIDSLIPEDHETCPSYLDCKEADDEKRRNNVIRACFMRSKRDKKSK